ncbi:hypothetical protein [Haladaptatus halobius]|uniref:hypothetical protein n=1 Tax=Haladaptatus halobius TaxID=2884875 RepID=UPI001D0A4B49|nr:hypothetical protein [Haladaptatus halobius]
MYARGDGDAGFAFERETTDATDANHSTPVRRTPATTTEDGRRRDGTSSRPVF